MVHCFRSIANDCGSRKHRRRFLLAVGWVCYNRRLVGFVIIKSVVGACFACLSSVKSAVSSDACGVANLRVISSASWDATGTGGTAGPIVAFTVTMARYYGGMDFGQAFALFFYIAAGIAFVIIILYALLHRAVQKN